MKNSLPGYLLALLVLSGCQSTFGPTALKNTHPAYNLAINQTLNQQMLLNLVRLRYRDRPYFLKVGSVTASLTFDGSIGIGTDINLAAGGNLIKPSLGIGYADKPTISFQPLQGEDFLKSVLSSISFDSLLVMTQSGWSIERVFGLTVERINNLHNAPRASGPTPEEEPEYKDFKRAIHLMRQLQLTHAMEIGPDENNELHILFKKTQANEALIKELSSLLGFNYPANSRTMLIKLNSNFLNTISNQLSIRPRSISSILFYLSHNIDVPQAHISEGLVTYTRSQNKHFNWAQTPAGEFFKINYSEDYPEHAFLSIPYRDHWFYIADNDLKTKSTFMLLTQLFDLQAGQSKYTGPTLTLPVR